MRLHEVAVPFETLPVTEGGARTETALGLADGPACPVIRRRLEETPVPLAEAFRDPEEVAPRSFLLPVPCAADGLLWLHRAVRVLPRHVPLPPLDLRQFFLRSNFRRLLDTWSR